MSVHGQIVHQEFHAVKLNTQMEDWGSGLTHLFAKETTLRGPWVRIPHLPPQYSDEAEVVKRLAHNESVVGSTPTVTTKLK